MEARTGPGARTYSMRMLLTVTAISTALAGCATSAPVNRFSGLTDTDTLDVAEQFLLRDCVRRAGFDYIVTDPRSVPRTRDFPYVVDDVAWARVHGYGTDVAQARKRVAARDPNNRYLQSLTPQRRTALVAVENGPNPFGLNIVTIDGLHYSRNPRSCVSRAQQRLYGDLAGWFGSMTSMDSIRYLRVTGVQRDPAFRRATRPWSTCMRSRGYRYRDPAAIGGAQDSRKPSRAQEIRLAVAEATCARSSGLAATAAALDRRYDQRLRSRYRRVVATYQRLRTAALPRARRIVGAAGHEPAR